MGQKCLLYIGPSLGKFSWKLGLIDYWYLLIFLTLFFIYSFIYWFIYLFTYLFFHLTYLAFCFELLFYLSTISVTFSHNLFYIIYYIYISLSHMFLTCSSLCYNIIIYLISMYLLHINWSFSPFSQLLVQLIWFSTLTWGATIKIRHFCLFCAKPAISSLMSMLLFQLVVISTICLFLT